MTEKLREFLIEVGLAVNSRCRSVFNSDTSLTTEVNTSPSDIIYQIDIEAEEVIIKMMEESASEFGGILLLAEGIGENDISFYPTGLAAKDAKTKIICDPIDGSRGLMYDKRPAFFFLAAAGAIDSIKLSDLDLSVMVELPIPKQGEWDVLSAVRNSGFKAERYNEKGNQGAVNLSPCEKSSIEGGFFSVSKILLCR